MCSIPVILKIYHSFSTHFPVARPEPQGDSVSDILLDPEGLCNFPPAIMAVIEHVLVVQRRTGNKPMWSTAGELPDWSLEVGTNLLWSTTGEL